MVQTVKQPNSIISETNIYKQESSKKGSKASNGSSSVRGRNPRNNHEINADTEFLPVLDSSTLPLSVQLQADDHPPKLYLHPKAPIPDEYKVHPTFKSPFAPLDYLQDVCGYEWVDLADNKVKNYHCEDVHIFYSYKDIEFLFADSNFYRENILNQLNRTRRISIIQSIGLPWGIKKPDPKNDNKIRVYKLTLNISDICAMQGIGNLKKYANNVGIDMDTKDFYTPEQKADMVNQYMDDPKKFEEYALADATCLIEIKKKTTDFYNQIASLIGVAPRTKWGFSTGKIVASIASEWLSNKLGVTVEQFCRMTELSGSKGITNLSRLLKKKHIIYTGMVDGGRAVRERETQTFINDFLVDIDISGCYGNGLRNQKYAVGIPNMTDTPTPLGKWLDKNESQLIPGLWYARISWDNAPFKQDLLISKAEKEFTHWDLGVQSSEVEHLSSIDKQDDREEKNVYDASMVLTTKSVSHAAFNHDALQALRECSSNQEWGWLLENAVIESSLMYRKRDKVEKVSRKMLKGVSASQSSNHVIDGVKQWVEVDLRPLMEILLAERAKHPKKTPMDVFLKLIINTIYGVIASEFFSTKGTGISNVVVGNNITLRARVLGWYMAKGLHSEMTITDGGCFRINSVLKFKSMSMNLLESLHKDNFTRDGKHIFAEAVPLMGYQITDNKQMDEVMSKEGDSRIVDLAAWNHLKSLFPFADIFKYEQYEFESKNWYKKLTLHSKVDYRLVSADGKSTIALRGMPKLWDEAKQEKVINPLADKLFDAIENGVPYSVVIDDKQILSQADWESHKRKSELLPHDTLKEVKVFYSHTPLAARYENMAHYKRLINRYTSAKNEARIKNYDASVVASVKPEDYINGSDDFDKETPLSLEFIPIDLDMCEEWNSESLS